MDWGCNQLEEADAFNASAMANCDGHIKPKRHRCALLDTLPEGPEGPVQAVVGRHHCAMPVPNPSPAHSSEGNEGNRRQGSEPANCFGCPEASHSLSADASLLREL